MENPNIQTDTRTQRTTEILPWVQRIASRLVGGPNVELSDDDFYSSFPAIVIGKRFGIMLDPEVTDPDKAEWVAVEKVFYADGDGSRRSIDYPEVIRHVNARPVIFDTFAVWFSVGLDRIVTDEE
jgi:hypothetical protein